MPHAISNPAINYIVLAFESVAWKVAYREFNRVRGRTSFPSAVRRSKDPVPFAVLFEDTAAMLSLIVAFAGIALSQILKMLVLDGYASIGIAVILAAAATFLAYETKGLIIGEGADPAITDGILRILQQHAAIKHINELRTLHLGPEEVLLSVDFADDRSSSDVEAAISDLEIEIKRTYPQIRRVFIEGAKLARAPAEPTAGAWHVGRNIAKSAAAANSLTRQHSTRHKPAHGVNALHRKTWQK